MSIFIGGSGSTGSSLLRQILNRNSQVYIYNETQLFCKKKLFDDWNGNKHRLNKRFIFGLRSSGIKMHTGIHLGDYDFGHDDFDNILVNAQNIAISSKSITHFAGSLFEKSNLKKNKKKWGEKTPANVYHFASIDKHFDNAQFIFCVRNPLDTIASLVSRGQNVYYATMQYLMNTSFGINFDQSNKQTLKYEDLVEKPEQVVMKLAAFLEIDFEDSMLNSTTQKRGNTRIKGWEYDETDPVRKNQISKFASLSLVKQSNILNAIHCLKIKNTFAEKHGLKVTSIADISQALDYSIPGSSGRPNKSLLVQKQMDMWHRTIKLYPFHIFNYPIEIC